MPFPADDLPVILQLKMIESEYLFGLPPVYFVRGKFLRMKYEPSLEADLFKQFIDGVPEEWERQDKEIKSPILFLFDGEKWTSAVFVIEGVSSAAEEKDQIARVARHVIAREKPL